MAEYDLSAQAKPPTLYDVARSAGVSHQTVSRVVKGESNIRADLRQRIEAAIRELDYRPNLTARALASSSRYRIGAIVYEFLEVGPSRMVKGASDGAKDAGYVLDILSLGARDSHSVEESLSIINPHDLAGLLVIAPSDPVMELIEKVGFTLPVHIESESLPESAPSQQAPNQRVAIEMVEHLVALGHRRFFHVSGPQEWAVARTRANAYWRGVEDAGGVSVGSIAGDWTPASGYAAGMAMPLDEGITAVVAGNDQMALGVLAALADRGVRVPEQLSVVGFDDIPEAAYFRPALTTVHRDFEGQGRVAVETLISRLNEGRTPVSELVESQLVIRDSSGPAPR